MKYDSREIYSNIMLHIMPYLYNICPSHGILHMQAVFEHAVKAIENLNMSDDIKCAIVIAAFLFILSDTLLFIASLNLLLVFQ